MTAHSTFGADGQATPGARLAVVVPAINEAARIAQTLAPVCGTADACVVVDGGSQDDTVLLARAAGARVLQSDRGRALQMNAGARLCADADILLFLHADTGLPAGWHQAVREALAQGASWGRFDVRMDSPGRLLGCVAAMMNLRSRWTGICTGDQAMFVAGAVFARVGGFAAIPLMEDVELSARLRRLAGRPACLRASVTTSARRWQRRGTWRTIFQMWWIRLLYFFRVSPQRLHAMYYGRS